MQENLRVTLLEIAHCREAVSTEMWLVPTQPTSLPTPAAVAVTAHTWWKGPLLGNLEPFLSIIRGASTQLT